MKEPDELEEEEYKQVSFKISIIRYLSNFLDKSINYFYRFHKEILKKNLKSFLDQKLKRLKLWKIKS